MSESKITRRGFLRTGLATSGLLLATPNLHSIQALAHVAEPAFAGDKLLVTIFLRGGADPLNMVMPLADESYKTLRPGIAVVKGEDAAGPIELDEVFGMHPSMSALKPFWDSGRLAPIVCAGSPHPTRSHFDAQDFMEYAAPGRRDVRDGWLNRFLAATSNAQNQEGIRAVAMQKRLPRSLRGKFNVLAAPGRRREEIDAVLDQFDDLYGGGDMKKDDGSMMERPEEKAAIDVGRETIEKLRRFYALVEDADVEESPVRYPKDQLGRGLEKIARAVKANAGLEVAGIDVGGWDTHANQGGETGTMARKLERLSQSLSAFAADLGDKRMKKVCVMVMTEFGRTCAENGNTGTDHGHGSLMLLLSGGLKGSKVHGRWKGLESKHLYQGRDLPVHTDFRAVFNETLEDFLGFEPDRKFFPDYRPPRSMKIFA